MGDKNKEELTSFLLGLVQSLLTKLSTRTFAEKYAECQMQKVHSPSLLGVQAMLLKSKV